MAMAGLYEIWRTRPATRTTRCGSRGPARCSPPRPRTRSATSTTGCRCWSSLSGTPPGSTRRTADADELKRLLVPAAPGRLEAYPVARGQQRAQQRSRAARRRSPTEPPRAGMTDGLGRRRPRTATPGCTATGRGTRSPRCCSGTAPAAASTPPTSRRSPRRCPGNGISVVRVEQPWRVAGKKIAPAPRGARRVLRRRRRTGCGCGLPWWSAAAAPAPGPPPVRRASSAPPATSRCRSRCTRPGARRSPRLDELEAVAGADARRAGGAGRVRPSRRVPARPGADRRARRRPRLQGAQARARHAGGGDGASSSRRCWSGWSATWSANRSRPVTCSNP